MTLRLLMVSVLLVCPITGCSSLWTVGQTPVAANPDRSCVKNFTTAGTFLTGQTFSSFEEHEGKKTTVVYGQVIRSLTSRGYQITNSDKNMGLVSATNPVIFGEGTTATMNVMVTNVNNRVRVETTFSIPGFTTTSTSEVRDEFCTILGQAFSSA